MAEPCSVYRYYDSYGTLIYVGITKRRVQRQREHNTDKDWWQYVHHQVVEHYPSVEKALGRETYLIQRYSPPFNTAGNRFSKQNRSQYLSLMRKGKSSQLSGFGQRGRVLVHS